MYYPSFFADSEAGPDIAEFNGEEFQPATAEAFKDPNAFDFLSQHGQANDAAANLARYIQDSVSSKCRVIYSGDANVQYEHP